MIKRKFLRNFYVRENRVAILYNESRIIIKFFEDESNDGYVFDFVNLLEEIDLYYYFSINDGHSYIIDGNNVFRMDDSYCDFDVFLRSKESGKWHAEVMTEDDREWRDAILKEFEY